MFTEVRPVYNVVSSTWENFPVLQDMRAAWGDFDSDGDRDVVLMGEGPSGPVTKLYLNNPSSTERPFAFEDARLAAPLPQLQDGALAWCDMDNDGDLDLAMTGRVTGVYDLRLTSVAETAELLAEGHALVIVALVAGDLHIRIFNREGDQVVDKSEAVLGIGPELTSLKELLTVDPFPDDTTIPAQARQGIIEKAASISDFSLLTSEPSGPAELRFHVLRNGGQDALGRWQFVESAISPNFTPAYLGCLSWADVNNDGFNDLFISGLAWQESTGKAELPFARIFISRNGLLASDAGIVLHEADGISRALVTGDPLPEDGTHIQRVTWTDLDRDGFADMILGGALVADYDNDYSYVGYRQEVWLNSQGRNWRRLGPQVEGGLLSSGLADGLIGAWLDSEPGGLSHYPIRELLGTSSASGGTGDWNGDGMMDMFFPGCAQQEGAPVGRVLRGTGVNPGSQQLLEWLPGFYPLDETPVEPCTRGWRNSAWVSADLLNSGSHQWLASQFDSTTSDAAYFGPPAFGVFAEDAAGSLEPVVGIDTGIGGRFRGALDAVDVNNDGRLELLVSGFDEVLNLDTRLYHLSPTRPANTRPLPPYGLTTQATASRVQFGWNAGPDAETDTRGLQFAIGLRRGQGNGATWYLRPGARLDGTRLRPGFEGTLPFTGEGYDLNLRLMSVENGFSLPATGRGLMVIAQVGLQRDLHIRVFDPAGRKLTDKVDAALPESAEKTSLKNYLRDTIPFPDAATMTPGQRRALIANGIAVAGHTSLGYVFDPFRNGEGFKLPDGTYFWSVQSIDTGGMGSAFSTEHSFTIGDPVNPNPPPPSDMGERQVDLPWRNSSIDVGDVDGDGDLDVVLAGRADNGLVGATVLRRNDGPHPTEPVTRDFSALPDLPPLELGAVRWGDMDGDGDLDLAMSGLSLGQPVTHIYRNNAGVLEIRQQLTGVESSALDWGDFDNDGDLDLIVTGYVDGTPLTRLYRNGGLVNQAPGGFDTQPTTLDHMGAGAAAWGDFDFDGDLDLLLCGDTGVYNQPPVPCTLPPLLPPGASFICSSTGQPAQPITRLYRNDGLASSGEWKFTGVATGLPPLLSYNGGRAVTARAEWCDLSGDGYPDLLLGGMIPSPGQLSYAATPSARIYRNAGPGSGLGAHWRFLPGQELLTGVLDDALQTLTCADWDNDGKPDVLLSGWINGPGSVFSQIALGNGLGDFYHGRVELITRVPPNAMVPPGEQHFAGGLAGFAHFNDDDNVDVIQSGRWGIQGIGGLGNYGAAGRMFLNRPVPRNLLPTAPAGLTASVDAAGTEVTLTWSAASDPVQRTPLTYNLDVRRVDGQPGGMPGMADPVTGRRRVSRPGNVEHHTSWKLRNLPAAEYLWSVQAIDASLATSGFTHAAQTFTVAAPRPPVIVPPPPMHKWVVVNPSLAAVDFLGVAAGRGARILVGRRGQVFLSLNQEPFAGIASGIYTDLFDVLIDSLGAIVVGDAGVIRTSSDGVSWAEAPSGVTSTLRAVAQGGNNWVAAGDGVILHSTDRHAWAPGMMPAGTVIQDLVWAKGRYVAAGERAQSGALLTSTDGLTWTDVTPAGLGRGHFTSVASDGQKFIAVGSDNGFFPRHNDVASSPDGISWTVAQTTDATPISAIIHTEDGWFAIGNYGEEVRRSMGGDVWETVYRDSFASTTTISENDGLLTLAGAQGIIFDAPTTGVSPDAWTQRSGAIPAQAAYYRFEGMAARDNTVVAIGSAGLNFLSQDGGLTWRRGIDGNFDGYYGIAHGAGRFVRTFRNGIESSEDGVTWEPAGVSDARAVAFGDGRFVALRHGGGFLLSNDGRTWNTVSENTPRCVGLAFGNGRFLAVEAFSGTVHTSTDGSTWTQPSSVTLAGSVSFARDRFFAMSSTGVFVPSVFSSSVDGVTWEPVAGFSPGIVPSQVIWHRERYVAIGSSSLLSADLVTWTTVPIPGNPIAAVSTGEGLVVSGEGMALLLAPDVTSTEPPEPPPLPTTLSVAGNPAPDLIRFNATGSAGQVVTLERSQNLDQWTAVETFTLAGGTEVLEVTFPDLGSADYFRLRWQP